MENQILIIPKFPIKNSRMLEVNDVVWHDGNLTHVVEKIYARHNYTNIDPFIYVIYYLSKGIHGVPRTKCTHIYFHLS